MYNSMHPPVQPSLACPTLSLTRPDLLSAIPQDSALVVKKLGAYPVGVGGYSDVWRGAMIRDDGVTVLVALKVLRASGSNIERLRKRLEREVLCWRPLHHENIAPFYGIVYDVVYQPNGFPAIVSQWYQNGAADAYLRTHTQANPVAIIQEIVAGIEYLHQKGVVHGDIKGGNVMVDDEGHAKLIDFGLSRLIDLEPNLTTTSATSSMRWCAPELLRYDARSTKSSDVYALGSTALELLTGQVPYDMIKESVVPLNVLNGVSPRSLSSGFRYDIPCAEKLWSLLEKCWQEAALRPSIHEFKWCLQHLYS